MRKEKKSKEEKKIKKKKLIVGVLNAACYMLYIPCF